MKHESNGEKKRPQIRTVQRDVIAPIASGLFLIGAGVLVFFTFRSFGWAVFMAILLYTAFEGIYRRLRSTVKNRDIAASLTLIIILFVVLGPLGTVMLLIIEQGVNIVGYLRNFVESDQILLLAKTFPGLIDFVTDRGFFWVYWLDRLFLVLNEYSDVIDSLRFGELVGGAYSYFLGGVGMSISFVLNLSFGLILLYFLLREGDSFYQMIRQAMPLSGEVVDQFKDRMKEILQAILKGNVFIAILQGTMVGIGLWVCGIPNALLYGSVASFLSIIPVIGTAFVWAPAALFLYFVEQEAVLGAGLAVYSFACYLILENIVKPRILDRKLGVHSLLLFFAILGGLKEFGITGFILGPLILAIFLTIWRIYHIWEESEELEPAQEGLNDVKDRGES